MKRLFLASTIALAAIAPSTNATEIPKILTDMDKQGYFKIIDKTPVNEVEGFTAVMVQDNDQGEFHVYWVDDEHQTIFTGDMVTAKGQNLTNFYQNKMIPSQADTFNQVFEKGLVLGNTKATVDTDNALYLFYEPFCGYCHKLHKKLKPLIDNGLNVQYIPVAFLRPNSMDAIAAIVKEDDPSKAFYMSDARILDHTEKVDKKLKDQVQFNGFVMRAMGIGGTPGIVYKNSDGKVVVARGLSDNQMNTIYKDLMARNENSKS